jgi:hypothetical protein
VTNIPPPFVGGTDSPRRDSDEEKALQTPYSPTREEAAASESVSAQGGQEEAAETEEFRAGGEADELYEEDLLPDMATEGEEIAIEGPMYDLDWPEQPEPETPAEGSEPADIGSDLQDFAPVETVVAEPTEPSAGDTEMPHYLLGPDSADAGVTTQPGDENVQPKEELVDLAATLQAGALGQSIRDLVQELNVYPPDIAVPRAFAAGYLAASKEKEK